MYVKLFAAVFAAVLPLAAPAQNHESWSGPMPFTEADFKKLSADHPRLFINRADFAEVKAGYATPAGRALGDRIIHHAELMLTYPPAERVMTGRRLLTVSRNVLFRVNTLLVAGAVTGREEFFDRAKAEALSAAAFGDWNPSHFLDVGEMTLAVATAYDWLFDRLSAAERDTLAGAIVDKGLKPSLPTKGNWWINGKNNWNQVCHAGLTAGALAIADREPEPAFAIIARAIEKMPLAMQAGYGSDGAYPEGPGYWAYGTEFNVVMLMLLENAFGHSFNLAEQPGFRRSGDYIQHSVGPTGRMYNFADNPPTRLNISFATTYLVKRFNRPELLDAPMRESFERYCAERPKNVATGGNRLMPLGILNLAAFPAADDRIAEPAARHFISNGDGVVPVAMLRTGWGKDATYLAMKGGAVDAPHAHMDVGAFVVDMAGMRVATDLGAENYNKIEQLGMSLWNMKADSDRWRIFRLGRMSHNIVVIADRDQTIPGKGVLIASAPDAVTWDLAPVYTGQLKSFRRTGRLLSASRGVEIHDQITGVAPGTAVRFQLCSGLDVAEVTADSVTLTQRGKGKVTLRSHTAGAAWRVVESSTLLASYDTATASRMLYLETVAPADGEVEFRVTMTPDK